MSVGFWQILIIALLLVLLFGRGKVSELMGDVAKGIKSFKKGMAEDDAEDTASEPEPAKVIEHAAGEPVVEAPQKPKAKTAGKRKAG